MKQIPLTGKHGIGKFALVDDEDFELLNQFKWHCKPHRNTFYGVRTQCIKGSGGKQLHFKIHRVIMGLTNPKDICDHKDHNGLNCQKSNLRVSTFSQNQQNTTSRKGSTSKYLGVYIDRKWYRARINGIQIGYFPKTPCGEILAALQYDNAAMIHFGEFANLNFKQNIGIGN